MLSNGEIIELILLEIPGTFKAKYACLLLTGVIIS